MKWKITRKQENGLPLRYEADGGLAVVRVKNAAGFTFWEGRIPTGEKLRHRDHVSAMKWCEERTTLAVQ